MIKMTNKGWIEFYKKNVISVVNKHFPKLAKKYYPTLKNGVIGVGYFGGNKIKVVYRTEALQWADKEEKEMNKEILNKILLSGWKLK